MMTLSEISQALQRGEALTDEQCQIVVDNLIGNGAKFSTLLDGIVVREAGKIKTVLRNPFPSTDAALAFVAEVFPDFVYTSGNMRDGVRVNWFRLSWASSPCLSGFDIHGDASAPTPSAAIMAAAIEAFLAKGGK